MSDTQKVQMRLRNETIELIEQLKERTKTNNRTRIVSASVELVEALAQLLEDGGELVVRKKSGKENVVKVVGTFSSLTNPKPRE